MLKKHLTFCNATIAAAAISLTVPALAQYEQDRGQPGQDRDERQREQERLRQPGQQPGQQRPGQQTGQPAADLPDEVRQVLTSLDGTWTVEGTFFGEGEEEAANVSQMSGKSQREWILNNHILKADLKLHPGGQGAQPGQQDPMQRQREQQERQPQQQQQGQQGQSTLEGTLADVSEARMTGADNNRTFAMVRMEDGKTAILAFDQKVEINELGISSGDEIKISGTPTQMAGQSVLRVQSLEANGRQIQLAGGEGNQPGQNRPGQDQQQAYGQPGAVEGMWFLGYDTAKDEYNAVWMDSKSTAIRCDTGRWESSERKLIFEGEYTKPETDDTVSTRVEIQVQTENRHVVTMFEDPGLLDPERRVYTLTFVRSGQGMAPGQDRPMDRPGQQRPGAQGQATTLDGTIAAFTEAQMQGADAQNKTFARVRLENGKQAILCFDQQVQVNQLGISSGDEIQIRGTETQMAGQTVITVESIRANGREVPLTGTPGQQRPGQQQPGQRPGQPGQGAQDANFRGEVAQITEAQVQGADATNRTFAHIRLQDGKDAILAFENKVDIEGLNISQGDQVTVLGTQTEMNGRTIINVRSILVNGRPVDLEAAGSGGN